MFGKILIANRGEIACRIIRTAKALGVRTVAVYSDADAGALHVEMADEAFRLGPAPVLKSYLNKERLIEVCKASGADAVHPGYGFFAENAGFAEAVEAAGLTFVGPPADAIRKMGLKDAAKDLMEKAGVPVVPGHQGDNQDPDFLKSQAEEIGFPVLIKARAGGGGRGMRRVEDPAAFAAALQAAMREAKSSFGDGHLLIEKCLTKARHIEVQIFADSHGNIVHLFERDCSLQRRHQKVIEEAPAPGMTGEMRAEMSAAAIRAAEAVGYQGAGTVEFIADISEGLRPDRFYFMEMNTRLQVEHPVTEMITGEDLVAWQLLVAAGEPLPRRQEELSLSGWAMEARIYAENAAKGFLPAAGRLDHLSLPGERAGLRVETGIREGNEITPFYDPMIAKLVAHGPTREAARANLAAALADCRISGAVTNIAFLAALTAHEGFAAGQVDTGLIERDLKALASEPDPPPEAFAIAALAALGLTAESKGSDPWSVLTAWRHWGDARQSAHLARQGGEIELSVVCKGNRAFLAGTPGEERELALLAAAEGSLRIDFAGHIVSAHVVSGNGTLTIFFDGRAHEFGLPDWLAESGVEEAGGDHLIAPMPGVVKSVAARKGGDVAKGEVLVVLEAMKMEHSLTAPRDGKVSGLFVKEGEQVEDGMVLLALVAEDA
jgi:3-methylcrotonyl-CoA carboxylase alpha subunit